VLERGLPGSVASHRQQIDVAEPLLLLPDVFLLPEDAELGAHRRIAPIAKQVPHDLVGGGAASAVEDVHDLPFAVRWCEVRRTRYVLRA
jgi:hypothetical protein